MLSAPEQARLTKPLRAAMPRQKSLAVWVAPIAQVLLEAKQALPSSISHSAVLVRHALHTRTPSLRRSDLKQSATQLRLDIWLASALAQVRLTKPQAAALDRQNSLAVWMAPVAQVMLEAKQVLLSSTSRRCSLD